MSSPHCSQLRVIEIVHVKGDGSPASKGGHNVSGIKGIGVIDI